MTSDEPNVVGTAKIDMNLDRPLADLQGVVHEAIAKAALGLRSTDLFKEPQLDLPEVFPEYRIGDPTDVAASKTAFRRWLIGALLRDCIEGLESLLWDVWRVAKVVTLPNESGLLRGSDFEKFRDEERKFKDSKTLGQKVVALRTDFPRFISPSWDRAIQGLVKLRNCLTHGKGVVRDRDLTTPRRLSVAWKALQLALIDSDGKRHQISANLIGGRHHGGDLWASLEWRRRFFRVGDRPQFSVQEFAELATGLILFATELRYNLITHLKTHGVALPAVPPPQFEFISLRSQDFRGLDYTRQVAEALFNKRATPEPRVAELVAATLLNRSLSLDALGHKEAAIEAYDDLVARFAERHEPAIAETVAMALYNKGTALGELGRIDEQLAVYDELISRCDDPLEPGLARFGASAFVNKGACLSTLGRNADALTTYDELVSRYGEHTDLAEQVAAALFNKANIICGLPPSEGVQVIHHDLLALDCIDEAIEGYDELVSRYSEYQQPRVAQLVAAALVNKGTILNALDRIAEAFEVYDEVVSRYGHHTEPRVAEKVATALIKKGMRLGDQGRTEEAIEVFAVIARRYEESPDSAIAEQVATALGRKGWYEYVAGRLEDSAASSWAALDHNPRATFARCNLALALLHLGYEEAARENYAVVVREIESVEDLDRLALHDLEGALAEHPDLAGSQEVLVMLLERRGVLKR